nr:glycosyltransferase family 2 protein [Salinirubrum litoreum]
MVRVVDTRSIHGGISRDKLGLIQFPVSVDSLTASDVQDDVHPEQIQLSVVLPVYNEKGNLRPLAEELREVLESEYDHWEALFVDDGSTDGSYGVLRELHEEDDRIKVIRFRGNFGQSPALDAGLDYALGEVVVTMDSDGQNDPADIPRLVDKLEEGYDCVSGWRSDRDDPLGKRISSRFASGLRQAFLGTELHDYGCTLKAYRRPAAKDMDLTGEMHRYIPALLSWHGYRIAEVEVNHRPRTAGETKYSWQRLPKGFLDLINVWFWQKFSGRPLHVFGGLGILSMGIGSLAGLYAAWLKLTASANLSETALPLFAVFMVMIGVQFFLSGILADISIKGYQHAKNEEPYRVRDVLDHDR